MAFKKSDEKFTMKYVVTALWNSIKVYSTDECYCCMSFKRSVSVNYSYREKIDYPTTDSPTPPRLRSTEHPKSKYEIHRYTKFLEVRNQANFDCSIFYGPNEPQNREDFAKLTVIKIGWLSTF